MTMIDTPLRPGETAEILIRLLTGHDSIDHTADALGVPVGQVRGWCERIRTSLHTPESRRWRSEHGDVDVTHTAECDGPPVYGSQITFTVEVTNNTRTDLFGVHLVQRAFTNAAMEHLELDTAWQFTHGDHALMKPADTHRYVATYMIGEDDFAYSGEIVNAIAIIGYTATGHQIWVEEDAIIGPTATQLSSTEQ